MTKRIKEGSASSERKNLPISVATAVLTEAGYRCAVPTCRTILALDLHHMHEVSEGGGDDLSNLIALCPTCHALYHRGTIKRESIQAWKGVLVALGRAFDREAMDLLLMLHKIGPQRVLVTADAWLRFAGLFAADLVEHAVWFKNDRVLLGGTGDGPSVSTHLVLFEPVLSTRGKLLVEAWKRGDRKAVEDALSVSPVPPRSEGVLPGTGGHIKDQDGRRWYTMVPGTIIQMPDGQEVGGEPPPASSDVAPESEGAR